MFPSRVVLLSALVLFCFLPALAQRPGPQFWRNGDCEPFEPRTRLETMDRLTGVVIVKGFTRITTVDVRGVRIDAIEMRQLGSNSRFKGIVVSLREGQPVGDNRERVNESRAFIDYDEIDSLLSAIDTMSRVDETTTKLVGFEARYRTSGDLEIAVFRQTRSGNAVTMSTGICDRVTGTLTLDEFAKVRAMIQEAKGRLDELR
ncbi:MAG TPA: hypothetical protein VFY51_10575 [Pyrinomonadaceae bacterium]|nr:hypothetical protein [Pyrinomonadaceae bacterium]